MTMNDDIMPQCVGLDGRQDIRLPPTEAERVMPTAIFREEILQGDVSDVIAMHEIEVPKMAQSDKVTKSNKIDKVT
jgi:hypothetical protein